MPLSRIDNEGVSAIEGSPDERLIVRVDDAARVVEACLSERVRSALLYPANLPDGFFDLSSGEAGAVIEKLRRYRIRLAVVCRPGAVTFSRRFHEFVADDFGVFTTRDAAVVWLAADASRGTATTT